MKASQWTWYIPSLFYSSFSHVWKFFYHHPSAFDLRYINVVYQTFSLWTFRLSSIFCLIMLKFIYESLFFVWLLLQKLVLVSVFNLKKKYFKTQFLNKKIRLDFQFSCAHIHFHMGKTGKGREVWAVPRRNPHQNDIWWIQLNGQVTCTCLTDYKLFFDDVSKTETC